MYYMHDPDEWKTVTESRPCTACDGYIQKCNGQCNGMYSVQTVRRDPKEVAEIKAQRRRAHEDAVLREADEIRAARHLTLAEQQTFDRALRRSTKPVT